VAKVTGRKRYGTQPQRAAGIAVPVFQGLVVSLVVSVISVVFLSFITLTSDSTFVEAYLKYIMVAVTMVSIFIGSAFATSKVESRALLVGMAVGCIYVLISVGIGLEITNDSITWPVLANKFLAGLAAGALGGVIGVNL